MHNTFSSAWFQLNFTRQNFMNFFISTCNTSTEAACNCFSSFDRCLHSRR